LRLRDAAFAGCVAWLGAAFCRLRARSFIQAQYCFLILLPRIVRRGFPFWKLSGKMNWAGDSIGGGSCNVG
jgi:hypothetical protein